MYAIKSAVAVCCVVVELEHLAWKSDLKYLLKNMFRKVELEPARGYKRPDHEDFRLCFFKLQTALC